VRYGPRFLATGAGSSPTRSAIDHTVLDTPAAMHGVIIDGINTGLIEGA
jgi:hypothetical protein